MAKNLALGLAALFLACGVLQGVEFSGRAYECPSNHTIFVSGFQRFVRLKNSDGDVSTRYNPTAGAVGYVYSQGPWYGGAAFSYEHGTRKYDERGSDVSYRERSDMPGISLFGGYKGFDGWYADVAAFGGYGTYKAREYRDAAAGFGGGNREHNMAFAASVEGGKEFNLGSFLLTPHIGVDWAHTQGETHRFANGYVRHVDSQSYLEIPLGVTFSKVFDCGNWSIIPKVDLTMVNAIGSMDVMNDQPGFVYRTGKGWKTAGVGGDHIGGRVSAGVAAKMNDKTTLGLDYSYEGRKSYNDHTISAVLGWSF